MKANFVVLFIITILISGCAESQLEFSGQNVNDNMEEKTVMLETSDKELNSNLPNEDKECS